jgi:hypothetical protein
MTNASIVVSQNVKVQLGYTSTKACSKASHPLACFSSCTRMNVTYKERIWPLDAFQATNTFSSQSWNFESINPSPTFLMIILSLSSCNQTYFSNFYRYRCPFVKCKMLDTTGYVGRIYKGLGMTCPLCECEPPVVAELWRSGSSGVVHVKTLSTRGDLILRYVQKNKSKAGDT